MQRYDLIVSKESKREQRELSQDLNYEPINSFLKLINCFTDVEMTPLCVKWDHRILLSLSGSSILGGPALNQSQSPGQNSRQFLADDIFECIFFNDNDRIPIQISLKFVPRSPTDNKPALVQVMAWRRTGDKPLPEPMITQLTDAYMRH